MTKKAHSPGNVTVLDGSDIGHHRPPLRCSAQTWAGQCAKRSICSVVPANAGFAPAVELCKDHLGSAVEGGVEIGQRRRLVLQNDLFVFVPGGGS